MRSTIAHIVITGLAAVLIAACSVGTPQASPSSSGGTSAPLEVGFPSTPDAGDVVMLLAFDRLNTQGWNVQPVFFAQPEADFGALATAEIVYGVGAVTSALAALESGGDFKIIAEQEGIPWSIVAAEGIAECADMVGKRFALHSTGGTTTTYANYWIGEECPAEAQEQIETIYIPGSENRAAALLANQIDATLLTTQDIALLEEQAPDRFTALANFGESSSLAKINSSVIAVNADYLALNGDRVREFLVAIQTAYADALADPSILAPVAAAYNVQWTDAVQESVRLELESGTLDPRLHIDQESMDFTIDFLKQYGEIGDITTSEATDLTPLQATGQ